MSENYPHGPEKPLLDLSEKTKAFYAMKAQYEIRRFEQWSGQPWKEQDVNFVRFFLDRQSKVKGNTWRLLRSCVRFYLQEQGASQEARDLLEASVGIPPEQRAVSSDARKMARKQFPREALDGILDILESDDRPHGGEYDGFLAAWLRANLEVGLRPAEWEFVEARQHDDQYLVFVRNAKATHGRGNGEYRTLFVPRSVFLMVQRAIELRDRLMEFGLTWKELQHRIRIRLYTVRQDVPQARNICLYSTRHQVIADAKSAGKSPAEIAAMVGHNSEDTNRRHYGKARVGRGVSHVLGAQGSAQPGHGQGNDLASGQAPQAN